MEKVILNAQEQKIVDYNQQKCNALGFEIPITTLTTILKKVSEQKFYEIPFAEYVPVIAGEGAWSTNLINYRSFMAADEFETGIINTGASNSRLAEADAGVDSITIKIENWAKSIGWSLPQLMQAAKAGNWDLVTAKEKARKRNFDLGLQKVAFLGTKDSKHKGLLNLVGITSDTTTLTKSLSSMTAGELNAFVKGAYEAYRANCNRTAKPTHFSIPESDFNGLASQMSADFPIKTKIEVLEDAFQRVTMNKSFKILPVAYADQAYSGLGLQRYVMYNYEEESLKMVLPVPYTNTLANSIDNFSFQNVAYAQFSGVTAIRPLEVLYFDF